MNGRSFSLGPFSPAGPGPEGVTFHDIRRTVKTNMLNAGVDQVHRDVILGHTLHGMDVHYMAPSIEDPHRAMAKYTAWLDGELNSRQEANKIF